MEPIFFWCTGAFGGDSWTNAKMVDLDLFWQLKVTVPGKCAGVRGAFVSTDSSLSCGVLLID